MLNVETSEEIRAKNIGKTHILKVVYFVSHNEILYNIDVSSFSDITEFGRQENMSSTSNGNQKCYLHRKYYSF